MSDIVRLLSIMNSGTDATQNKVTQFINILPFQVLQYFQWDCIFVKGSQGGPNSRVKSIQVGFKDQRWFNKKKFNMYKAFNF